MDKRSDPPVPEPVLIPDVATSPHPVGHVLPQPPGFAPLEGERPQGDPSGVGAVSPEWAAGPPRPETPRLPAPPTPPTPD